MRLPGRADLVLFLVSCFVTLLGLELAIRAGLVPLPEYVLSDGWQRERWLRAREQDGRVTKHRIDRFDPELGWTLAPGLAGVPLNGALVHSNAAGMRGQREYPRERGPGARVVALGDSFTFGQCVGDDETFAARLEQRIAPGEVLNLAVHGYGHDQMLLRLRRDGLPYRPDVVLLGFYNADVERNQLRFRDYAKPRFRVRDRALELETGDIPAPDDLAASFHLRSANYARMLRDTLFADRLKRRNKRRTEAILRATAAEAAAAGARLALVYLPSENQVRAGRSWPQSAYKRVCGEGLALCVDPTARLHAWLAGQSDPASHFRCHYSPELHREIGEEIAAVLASAGLAALAR
jgi:hypothetical protein